MSVRVSVFLFSDVSAFVLTLGITNTNKVATRRPIIPTTKNGNVNPPSSNRNAPKAGPKKMQTLTNSNIIDQPCNIMVVIRGLL